MARERGVYRKARALLAERFNLRANESHRPVAANEVFRHVLPLLTLVPKGRRNGGVIGGCVLLTNQSGERLSAAPPYLEIIMTARLKEKKGGEKHLRKKEGLGIGGKKRRGEEVKRRGGGE